MKVPTPTDRATVERIRTIIARPWIGAFLGLAAGLACLPLLFSLTFQGFEQRTVDWRMQLRGTAASAPEIAVCAIDARSVDRLGQWPWPRSKVGELIRRLDDAGARTIALDIIFSEPSRLVSAEDAALASAIESAGNVVLGFYLTHDLGEGADPAGDPLPPLPVEVAITPPRGFPELGEFPGIESNIDLISRASSYSGHFVVQPDIDGTVRHYPLILSHAGTIYPSLALRASQLFLGSAEISVRPYQGEIPLIGLGELTIPTSEKGELWINFRGAYGQTFPYYSVVDILDGNFAPDAFKDRLVFIGATETGIADIKTSPFNVTVPGVEIHATVADNLLHRRFIRDGATESLLGALALLLLALLAGASAAAFRRSLTGASVALALMLLYVLASFLAFALLDRHLFLFVPLLAGALGYIAAAVWRNIFAEARAREIRKTFTQFVSESVVQEMLADPEKVRLGGEKRELTVLFADIRGFTKLAERVPPERVVELLNQFLTPMTKIILDEGGTLDKYMGDAIMAIFGAPLAMPDHPARACAAALAMGEAISDLFGSSEDRELSAISCGVGINTGSMAVGNMGSDLIFDYTVIGDNVNLGARLEGLTRLYGVDVIVGEDTRSTAGEAFVYRELDRVRVKGRQQPVRIYELMGPIERKEELRPFLSWFANGIAAYRELDLDAAATRFRKAGELRAGDGPVALYLKRIDEFRSNPPAPDWDGVTNFTTK